MLLRLLLLLLLLGLCLSILRLASISEDVDNTIFKTNFILKGNSTPSIGEFKSFSSGVPASFAVWFVVGTYKHL